MCFIKDRNCVNKDCSMFSIQVISKEKVKVYSKCIVIYFKYQGVNNHICGSSPHVNLTKLFHLKIEHQKA